MLKATLKLEMYIIQTKDLFDKSGDLNENKEYNLGICLNVADSCHGSLSGSTGKLMVIDTACILSNAKS